MRTNKSNRDEEVIAGFGDEWHRFDQGELLQSDRATIFEDYFSIFPWSMLPNNAVGADIGCGSGRWALLAAPRVGVLHCVDPSGALEVAKSNLAKLTNVKFHRAAVDDLPFPDCSLDFAYCLGVLHHVPDTAAAICNVAAKLKPGAPLLLYLYYAFDNRPRWFRLLWSISDIVRRLVSRLPNNLRYAVSQVLAVLVYWPLAKSAQFLEHLGHLPKSWPLAYYRDKNFYVMRTDALDRFGTRLEHRFSRTQIHNMLETAGFHRISFAEHVPYWCCVGIKA
ncbi:MAG: class I SAM-dependent methyltransferase [Thiobacillaceae bacterium]